MSKESVYATLSTILTSRIGIDETRLGIESRDLILTGDIFRLDDITMVYLFCEVEKTFGLRIPREILDDYGFSTISKIVDIVYSLCT